MLGEMKGTRLVIHSFVILRRCFECRVYKASNLNGKMIIHSKFESMGLVIHSWVFEDAVSTAEVIWRQEGL
jgi:hypothetical protein